VRILLDFYRVVGVPIQSTPEQIAQAYQDRSKQLPRKEYSEQVVLAQRKILDQAYSSLKDPLIKDEYDRQFLSLFQSNETNTYKDKYKVHPQSFPVLEFDAENLVGVLAILQELGEYEQVLQLGASSINSNVVDHREDILFSMALAYLELSKENWRQKNYNQSLLYAQLGLELLKKNQAFPSLQQEIELELIKLLPYRILDIYSQKPIQDSIERKQAYELLHKLFAVIQNFEGKKNNYLGLDLNGFLSFIEKLRPLLTIDEQKKLFTTESTFFSSAGLYILVYALIAEGFSRKNADIIHSVFEKLAILREKQDVTVEISICLLLLGQEKLALEEIKKCKDITILSILEKHFENQEDLLLGLCYYCKKWLESEVFPHFLDLVDSKISLDEYFFDKNVQGYIEHLDGNFSINNLFPTAPDGVSEMVNQRQQNYISAEYETSSRVRPKRTTPNLSRFSTSSPSIEADFSSDSSTISTGNNRKKRIKIKPRRLLIVLSLFGFATGSLIYSAHYIHEQLLERNGSVISGLEGDQLSIGLNQPIINESLYSPPAQLNNQSAKMLLQNWFKVKSNALGESHITASLNQVLTQPILSIWQQRAKDLKDSQDYKIFTNEVEIKSVKLISSTKAQIVAHIKETSNYYHDGKLNPENSYHDDALFQYDLEKQGDSWLISNSSILKQ